MLQIEEFTRLVMKQAKEKGFGTTPEEISVPEKVALIHSELAEAYAAYLEGNYTKRQGVYEEFSDSLQRILHLGGIYKVDFSITATGSIDRIAKKPFEIQLLVLHNILSETYEFYRQNNQEDFLKGIVLFGSALLLVVEEQKMPLEEAMRKKMEINTGRIWDPKKLNEKLSKVN